MHPFHLPVPPPYLVALSGGADSVLLLELTVRALLECHPEGKPGELATAVHLNHGIRGEEANRDADFCAALCEKRGIPLVTAYADVPALAKASGESIETEARRARYALFFRVMTERSIPTLLTAHHADDNLETLLERLLRGSGTRGMGGIPPSRSLGYTPNGLPLTVYRPLLEWTKADILTACAAFGLDYVIDSTNLEVAYTRNRLRHTVIPLLEDLSGEGIPQRTALRLSRAAREDEECLMGLAESQVDSDLLPDGGISLERLQEHSPAISKRMLSILYERVTAAANPHDGSGTLTAAHLEALWALVQKGTPEASLNLPRGMVARIRENGFYIRPAESPPPPLPAALRPLGAGVTVWDEGGEGHPAVTVEVEVTDSPLPPLTGKAVFASAVFPAESLSLPLWGRPRQSGDVLRCHGMTKKLKKIICDKDIPLCLRDRLPLLCLSDGTPLWYPGVGFRDGYPAPETGACLRVTVRLQKTDYPFEKPCKKGAFTV